MQKIIHVRTDSESERKLSALMAEWNCTASEAIRHLIKECSPLWIPAYVRPATPKPSAPRVPGRGRGRPAMPPPPEGFRSWKSFNAYHAKHNEPTPPPVASNPSHPSSDLQSVLNQLER